MKPREFWVVYDDPENPLGVYAGDKKPDDGVLAHRKVREIIEITDADIEQACQQYTNIEMYSIIKRQEYKAFEAGARWAIAKMRGE